MVGTTLSGRYRIEDRLATGGMGTVFHGIDERLRRPVAIKILRADLAGDESARERFRREARAVAALSHPNIAGIFDYGQDGDRHYIVMELVDGTDLSRLLNEQGPIAPERAADIAEQAARALGHAHAAGIVHRDVKPANIIVTPDGRVKVTDFGIARAVTDATLTGTGTVLGTAHYMSPEHASGDPVTPRSDVYSLGIVLYEMLTGSVPFTAETPVGVAMRHLSQDVPRPSEANPSVPGWLDNIVTRATDKAPAGRFDDGEAMAAAVAARAATATGGPAATAPLESPSTVWPIPGERWDPMVVGRWVLATFAVLAVLAGALVLWRLSAGTEAGPQPRNRVPPPETAATQEPAAGEVVVPNLIGSNFKDAKDVLEDMGLQAAEQRSPADADKDTVVDMQPKPEERVPQGTTITLFVSEGPQDEENGSEQDEDEGEGHEDEDKPGKGPPEGRGLGRD